MGPTAARLSGHAPSRLKLALVTVQVALALALLTTAGQFINTFRTSMAGTGIPGADRVLEAAFDLDHLDVPQSAGDDFYRRLLERARARPDVAAAAITNGLTLSRFGEGSRQIAFRVWPADDAPPDGFPTSAIHVEGDLFDVLGLDLLQGRTDTAQGVIVNRAPADRFFEGQAMSRTFEIARFDRLAARHAVTVTGVVESGPIRLARPMIFLPSPVAYDRARTLHLRIRPGTAFDAAALQDVVRQIDPRVPIASLAICVVSTSHSPGLCQPAESEAGAKPRSYRLSSGWDRAEWEATAGVEGLGRGLPESRPCCGSLTEEPGMAERLAVRYGNSLFRSRQTVRRGSCTADDLRPERKLDWRHRVVSCAFRRELRRSHECVRTVGGRWLRPLEARP